MANMSENFIEIDKNAKSIKDDYVRMLAKTFSLDVSDIPGCVEQNAKQLLIVLDKICIEDPILVIQWTDPWPRSGKNQTKDDIINYIKNNGGTEQFDSGTIFSFCSGRQLGNCMSNIPLWARHDRNNTDIKDVGHCYRINKESESISDLEDYGLVFNF